MSCTALPKAMSSVRGRTLVGGRPAAADGATGSTTGPAGGDCLTGVPLDGTLGLGGAVVVLFTGLAAALAVVLGPAPTRGAAPAEQPARTASAAAAARARATVAERATAARCRPPCPPMSGPVTVDEGTRRGQRRRGDGEVRIPVRATLGGVPGCVAGAPPRAVLSRGGGRRAPRSPPAAAAGTRVAAA